MQFAAAARGGCFEDKLWLLYEKLDIAVDWRGSGEKTTKKETLKHRLTPSEAKPKLRRRSCGLRRS